MAKNCVVSISPVSPYQEPMPHSSGSGLNAPGGCLSKPTTSASSAPPATSIACAVDQRRAAGRAAVLDVDEGQAGEPERRHRRVGVARRVGAAGGEVDLLPADARVGQRRARGDRRHLEAGDARRGGRTGGCRGRRPRRRSCATGPNAKVIVSRSPGAGISVSSIGMPICSRSGSDSVSRASTRTSPGSST